MPKIDLAKSSKLDDIISDLSDTTSLEKTITKTVSVRIPVIDLARIDVLAGMKDVSRNVLLNDVIDAALSELLNKLHDTNSPLAEKVEAQSKALAEHMLSHHDEEHPKHPKPPKGPKGHKKPKKPHESE